MVSCGDGDAGGFGGGVTTNEGPWDADFERTFRNFASLSAACCADMEEGCKETWSRHLAWGKEDSEHDTLGRANNCSLRKLVAFLDASTVLERVDMRSEEEEYRKEEGRKTKYRTTRSRPKK